MINTLHRVLAVPFSLRFTSYTVTDAGFRNFPAKFFGMWLEAELSVQKMRGISFDRLVEAYGDARAEDFLFEELVDAARGADDELIGTADGPFDSFE